MHFNRPCNLLLLAGCVAPGAAFAPVGPVCRHHQPRRSRSRAVGSQDDDDWGVEAPPPDSGPPDLGFDPPPRPVAKPGFDEPPERDMFVPVLTVVSLLGLAAAYGFETFRLWQAGQLYLPKIF